MQLYQLILLIIFSILFISLFNIKTTNIGKKKYKSEAKEKKKVITKNTLEDNNKNFIKKKVTFNLDNNKVYNIAPNKKKKKFYEINSKKDIFYGQDIINNHQVKKIADSNNLFSPQANLINRLNKIRKNTIFKESDSYWNTLNIGNFTDRDYLNVQINNFNAFKNSNNYKNMEISKVYDNLTMGNTNPLNKKYDDESILKDNHNINGFSHECTNLKF